MAVKVKERDILTCAFEIFNDHNIKNIKVEPVAPTEKRVKFQLLIKDLLTKQNFGLMANNTNDVKSLLPMLIKSLVEFRENKIKKD